MNRHSAFVFVLIIASLFIIARAQTERWVYRYNGPGDTVDCASSLIYGADGNIHSAGYSTGSGTYEDFTVISLNPAIGIQEQREEVEKGAFFTIRSITKGRIKFSLSLSEPLKINLSLYNLIGRKVFSFDIPAKKGTSLHQKNLPFLSSGIYLLRVEVKGKELNRKFLLLK